ncbi:MAG: D-glucuronyl C5-epimerase family protein [Gaiellaceae bacterium]
MLRRTILLAVVVAILPAAAPARETWRVDVGLAKRGLGLAVESGRLDPADAARYRGILYRTENALPLVNRYRYRDLAGVLHDVALRWRAYNAANALTLFSMLDLNVRYLARRDPPQAGTTTVASDGIVYRAFPGQGFQFHPLANFARLNTLVLAADPATVPLAQALIARGVPVGDRMRWEYGFPFEGASPPWVSGMAQAVAAQALARTAAKFDPALMDDARAAYRTVPAGLVELVAGVPWIKLYDFSREAVLNAQLQAVISLGDYAALSGDTGAQTLADALAQSSRTLLPRFDTGYWSLYSLGGPYANLNYHTYVVSLLAKLAVRTKDPFWKSYADRFSAYVTEPPALKPGPQAPPVYPRDTVRDAALVKFWLSKPAQVTLTAAGVRVSVWLLGGWHGVVVRPKPLAPGEYPVAVRAVDLAGNAATQALAPLEIRRDTTPPVVSARLRGLTLSWRATDDVSTYLHLWVRIYGGGPAFTHDLGRRPMRGSVRLRAPAGSWRATLYAADASGNARRVPLGGLLGRG